jgi:uncharacterized membrane protein
MLLGTVLLIVGLLLIIFGLVVHGQRDLFWVGVSVAVVGLTTIAVNAWMARRIRA